MKINEKIGQMTTTWAQFAPEKSYCNLTLAAATSAFQPVFDVRQEMMEADLRYSALIARRDRLTTFSGNTMTTFSGSPLATMSGVSARN